MASFKKILRVLFPPPQKKKKKSNRSRKNKGADSLFSKAVKVLFPTPKKKKGKKTNSGGHQTDLPTTKPEQKEEPDILLNQVPIETKTHLVPVSFFIRLNKIILATIIVSLVFLIVLIVEHFSLYPLVETQYNYAEIIGPDQNFVNVIHTKHIDNEELVENLIRNYVTQREQILKKPSAMVEKFSSPEVYAQYFSILQTIAEKDIRHKLRRHLKIIRYQKIEKNIRQIEVEFTDLLKKPGKKDPVVLKSIWLINIKFDFSDVLRRFDEVAINPAGLMISRYAIKKIS